MTRFFSLLTLVLLISPVAFAGELVEYYRGARMMAMGGAYTAIADDEQTVWLNPAGLGGNRKREVHYAIIDLDASVDFIAFALSGGAGLNDPSTVIGKNITGVAQVTPTFLMGNFAIGFLVESRFGLHSQDTALPQMSLLYQTTNGIQGAFGMSLSRKKKTRGELRLGVAGKYLFRRGGERELSLTDIVNLSMDKVNQLAGNFAYGIGLDLGMQYIQHLSKNMRVMAGAAFTNLGDVTFGTGQPQAIRQNLSSGIAGQFSFRQTRLTLAYDYRHILEETDWRKKSHLGLEVALPMLSLYGGINQVNLTYGAAFDAWIFRLTALSYTEELGSFAHQNKESRYALRIGLKFNL